MRETVLLLHVAAGTAGLLLGPLWLLLRLGGRRGTATATAYLAAVGAVAVTGCALALTAPGLGWLVGVGVLSAALAGTGAVARRRGWPHWRTLQPHLLGGSYIALTTGLLVAATGNPVAWVLPALAGQLPIALAKRRLAAAAPA
ncbi:hypothetical protein JD79_00794 [Geodermatophilus normandii]|uniref:DUF2306 domain-containing protein n=1 Tax=Geodermatophilus normandii TaxID=1137989 RepID=A0A317QF30_9ACTN|nr:hypothetical protein [Geodermatophilus normandii]PWW21659.1 hypothetical protein JD79_00794 [Geodermatophilus normandii]